jgi:hypothetical protein
VAHGGGLATPKQADLEVAKKWSWGWFDQNGGGLATSLYIYIYINEIIKIIIKIYDSHFSIEVYHGDRCRACTPTHVGCHGWTLILDEKMDGGYISIFSYTTCTTYNKK